jgi:hypothetical protein
MILFSDPRIGFVIKRTECPLGGEGAPQRIERQTLGGGMISQEARG